MRLQWKNAPRMDLDKARELITLEEPLCAMVDDGTHLWYYYVPEGTVSDGASIPQVAWSVMGHPLMAPYRRSAVLHDFLCRIKGEPSEVVHRVFWAGLRADGVGRVKAWLMYQAVRRFGPRFGEGL